MAETSIEWTEKTWNPTTGCDRISEGCTFGARPMNLDWVRELITKARDAGTAIFVKQLGTVLGGRGKGGDWDSWPADLRIREYPPTNRA